LHWFPSAASDQCEKNAMKKHSLPREVCTKSLVVLVVAVATIGSYVSLALESRILPRHRLG
jgi:hypothetical protein